MVLLLSGGEVDRARNVMTWVDEIHSIPIMEARNLIGGAFNHVIRPILRDQDLEHGRVGIDEVAFAQVEEFARVLPGVRLADGDTVMQRLRLVKTPADLAVMQEAAAIGDAVTEAAIAAVRPGVREYDVVAEAMHVLYSLGGEMAHLATPFVASGEHMSPPNRFASDKIIREGDLVFIDIGAQYNGYFADVGRTVICGSPSRKQQEIFSAVHHSLKEAIAAMKVGATNDDVAAAAIAAGSARGFGNHFLSLFIGHGIGMGANEPPYIGEAHHGSETVLLQEGMTMAVEPLIWLPDVRGGGGVRLEDTVQVGLNGGIPLTRTRYDLDLLLD
jgi:Xaa-Pro aminopeptidase